MPLHDKTFQYLKPTDSQVNKMEQMREAVKLYSDMIQHYLPEGPDKTHAQRKLREVAMWVNVALTRDASGRPLED